MCGLCGFVDVRHQLAREQRAPVLTRMADAIRHRGPDDGGYWFDDEAGVGLGHRRLSIVDLSPEGHQPMISACGRYVIAFNGEIYNYKDIRAELEREGAAPRWRGHSDTEVMLAAISRWGMRAALERFNGMFAFALWDKQERTLSIARDRLGEKPLYYGWMDGVLLFGSELRSLRAHPAWRGEIDHGAAALYARLCYVPDPYSIYKDIYKLSPGTYAVFSFASGVPRAIVEPTAYWSMRQVAEYGSANLLDLSDEQAIDRLDELLKDSVRLRMEADVPLGAFLSGGVDSSTVVALMQQQSSRPIRTFSIGFHEEGYNEAEHASRVARHLGTEHTELYVTAEDARAVIPRLPHIYDEPFSDSSQIPTFLVSDMARKHVTVSLSGDGGDELFGGYNRYHLGHSVWKKIGWMPLAVRRAVAAVLTAIRPEQQDALFRLLEPLLPASTRVSQPSDKLKKIAHILRIEGPEQFYQTLVSQWLPENGVVIGGREHPIALTDKKQWPKVNDYPHLMMYQDSVGYLPGDILTKVDRASMATSLEARVPLLDHRLVEFAWRLPLSMKVRDGNGKWILKQVLYRYVPRELIDRPKVGFAIPFGEWLTGPLREWSEDLLSEQKLRDSGVFDVQLVRSRWAEQLSGRQDWKYHLWTILMFQSWMEAHR